MSKKLANYYSYTPEQFYKATRLDLCKQVTGCAGGGGGGLTQVTTTNSGTVIFNGNGTVDSPLTADVEVSGITTLYTGDSVITGNRVVTMPANQALTFNSTSPTQFAVTLQTAALVVSNTGGSTILLNTNSGTDYLNVGSAGTRLVSPLASVDLSFSGGIKILRGDDNGTNYSRFLMAPGTSTPPSWNDVSANGGSAVTIQAPSSNSTDGVISSSVLITNGYSVSARITPQRFYINKNIFSPSSNTRLFEVNQDGSIYFPAILSATTLATDGTGKVIPAPVTVTKGNASFTADDTTTVMNIPHGLGTTPTWFIAFNLTGLSGNYAARVITADATNITITFANPPSTVDGNALFAWRAEI